MKAHDIDDALRQARPLEPAGWATSAEGRAVLASVLEAKRSTPTESSGRPMPPRRGQYLRVGSVAAAIVLVAVGTILGLRFMSDQSDTGYEYRTADVAFFTRLQFGGDTREVEHYKTIESGARAASAVVVAEIVDAKHTRTITGEEPWDQLHMIGIVIRPVEVLRGNLPPEFSQQLIVEFMTSVDPKESVADLRATLPEGKSVWFLRSKAEEVKRAEQATAQSGKELSPGDRARFEVEKAFYRLTSSHGLFIQGPQHVINPVAHPHDTNEGTMLSQGERFAQIGELVAAIRSGR